MHRTLNSLFASCSESLSEYLCAGKDNLPDEPWHGLDRNVSETSVSVELHTMESKSNGLTYLKSGPAYGRHKSRDHQKLLGLRTRTSSTNRGPLVTMTGALSGSQSKKRKHRHTEDLDTTPSASQKKKEKRHNATVAPPSEDALSSQKRKPKSPKDKGKSRTLDHPSEFRVINASIVLSIPPVFASDLRAGVEEMLDSMVMR